MIATSRSVTAWRPLAWDLVPVVALAIFAVVTADHGEGRILTGELVMVAALLLRRRWPIPVLVVVSILASATSMGTHGPWVQVASVAMAALSLGEVEADRIRSALVILIVGCAIALAFISQRAETLESIVLPFVILVPSWLLGDILRGRRLEAIARAEAEDRAGREAEARIQAAVAEERRAMARELHDVVAHGVSVMLIQAGAARQVVAQSPEQATEALLTVEATGREAMTELRRLLGVLDEEVDGGDGAGVAPQPGIDQLEVLVGRVREAGLPTAFEVAGTPRSVPPSLDVTVYRIVQEALTNALRYARQAATLVRLSWEPTQLRVEILDDGPVGPTMDAQGAGRGLAGMHERAERAGGRLEAGPRLGGGYAVRAWLPLPVAPEIP